VAVAVDAGGRRQVLLAAHRAAALVARLGEPGAFAGRPARALLDGAVVVEVAVQEALVADVDTPEDLARARRRHRVPGPARD
jgi:molybdopterin-guanine dinucleotide biosynthesis protein A